MPKLNLTRDVEGVRFSAEGIAGDWLHAPFDFLGSDTQRVALLAQLEEDGLALFAGSEVRLTWDAVYRLEETGYAGIDRNILLLPPIKRWRPILDSRGSLSDADFTITIKGWVDDDQTKHIDDVGTRGAIVTCANVESLLPRAAWQTLDAVRRFQARSQNDRSSDTNKRAWAKIRLHAIDAEADLSLFLASTVVLTPERLKLSLRKSDSSIGSLVEVTPGFEGQPNRWLEIFDRMTQVPARYEVPDGRGLVHVLISQETRTVLTEIKRMPGRRIAGDRARSFLRNPFALLGHDAETVIDPDQFERAREDAGISFSRFLAHVRRSETGFVIETGLLIEDTTGGTSATIKLLFTTPDSLEAFVDELSRKLQDNAECCLWEGYELEILGDAADQIAILRQALVDWRAQFPSTVPWDNLSPRIERELGEELPYSSPYIESRSTVWPPENSDIWFTVHGSNGPVLVRLPQDILETLDDEIATAEREHRDTISVPGCPEPLPCAQVKEIRDTLKQARECFGRGHADAKTREKLKRVGLVVKSNVDQIFYEEERGSLDPDSRAPAHLPTALRPEVSLKPHQAEGVRWLQHLYRHSPENCRGCLLADDMGLGKTLQVLAFVLRCIEDNPRCDPFLIVAPVSLLDNWVRELKKFFEAEHIPILALYGNTLAKLRVPSAAQPVGNLLKRDWRGNAKIVLTTYETMRDLEFALALQKWTAMVCDEAQKIKNPNAMVTRSAKKQNARFKIACTGTPVENTLIDLWCLFDFIQPGLLGSLKEFGSSYRKPIEAETREEVQAVENLRALINPQTLRRTKEDVAKDLPRKENNPDPSCRVLPISERQRGYYAGAVAQYTKPESGTKSSGGSRVLALIQYLRRLCSDPHLPGQLVTDQEDITELERHSPKLRWLIQSLERMREKGEKAIIFCEFRDLQRTLQRAIRLRLGITADIINGDTSSRLEAETSRQRRIDAFQNLSGFNAIILSPLAVGFGVNIQAANHVVHFTRHWNPAKEDQATDRAYRIGQIRDVSVYCPLVVAEDFVTFDKKLDELLDAKRKLAKDMLNGSGDISPADFTNIQDVGGSPAFGATLLSAQEISSLDPNAFETFCATLWAKMGYMTVYRTQRTGDGGIDVVAIKSREGVLMQCKTSVSGQRELGWDAVKDVVAGTAAYAARHPGVRFSRVAATNAKFNSAAETQAGLNHVQLIDRHKLAALLRQYPITTAELVRFS
jgi:HJR/Mrr/RecB family endonuclease